MIICYIKYHKIDEIELKEVYIWSIIILKKNFKATILGIENDKYKAEIVDENGNRIEIRMITDDEIESVLLKK